MNVSQGQISSATKALTAQQNLLHDKGLTSEDFNATTLSQTLDQLNTDFNLVKGRIQGVDFNSVKDMMPQFIALQGQIGQINVETLDRSVNDHQASIDNLQPLILQERQGVQDLVDNATALQPLVPHANELLDLPARVQVLENAEQQPLDTDIDAKVEAVTRMLEEMKQLKEAIYKTPAAQNVVKSQFGSAKIPELSSLDPSDFKTWRERFLALSQLQNWSDEHMKKALTLAVPDAKVYIPLKLSTPNWGELTAMQILDKWEKRCCPDSYRDLANANLATLHQGMDEASQAYIDRATELYIAARFELDARDPETDEQFILRLINSFRDARLRAPLRRRKPKMLTELRVALNEEVNIIDNDPMNSSGNLAA